MGQRYPSRIKIVGAVRAVVLEERRRIYGIDLLATARHSRITRLPTRKNLVLND